MNGATARKPAPARAGSRCRQVCAQSGNPCRQSASGPDPASSSPNSRSLARTVLARNGTGAATPERYPRQPAARAGVIATGVSARLLVSGVPCAVCRVPSGRGDVGVEVEHVARVVLGLDPGQPLVLSRAIAAAYLLIPVLGRAVDVAIAAADGVRAQRRPEVAHPAAISGQQAGIRRGADDEGAV